MTPSEQDKVPILSQPLLTDEGYLNEACMNELAAFIKNMPETWERLKDEPEWNTPKWTTLSDIVGALANAAVGNYQGYPIGLDAVIGYTSACLKRDPRFKDMGGCWMGEVSLCDINKFLWDTLGDLQAFKNWNEKSVMGERWLCLSATLHQTCVIIRTERREFEAFNARFDAEQRAKHDAK